MEWNGMKYNGTENFILSSAAKQSYILIIG